MVREGGIVGVLGCVLGEKGGLGGSKPGTLKMGVGVESLSSLGSGTWPRPAHLLQVDVLVPVAHPDSGTVQVLRHPPVSVSVSRPPCMQAVLARPSP